MNVILKKNLLMLCTLLFTHSAFAFTGPYVGVEAGANFTGWRNKDNVGKQTSFASHGIIGGLFAGYGIGEGLYYLGLEGFVDDASNKSPYRDINAAATERRVSRTYGYGISILPGFNVSGSLLYLRLGYVTTRYQIVDVYANPMTARPLINGSQVGVGLETATGDDIEIRAEYSFSSYHSDNNSNGSFTARESKLAIGVIYKFC